MPRLVVENKRSQIVKTVVTIDTDLGDDFFFFDAALDFTILGKSSSKPNVILMETVHWNSGMRSLPVEITLPSLYSAQPIRLQVTASVKPRDVVQMDGGHVVMQPIIPATSAFIDPSKNSLVAEDQVERPLALFSGGNITIWEDAGVSMARHIWDAGVAFVSLLDRIANSKMWDLPALDKTLAEVSRGRHIQVLELGAGCGLAGVAFAKLIPHSQVLITDLHDAERLVKRNIVANKAAKRSNANFQVLDWSEDLPPNIAKQRYDLVLLADCIYNEDSIPALVKTLTSLSSSSPDVLIIVATKTRHSSEAMFFKMMEVANFRMQAQTYILAPAGYSADDLADAEHIDVYEFVVKTGSSLSTLSK